ncbi:MAG TPA: hydrogenase maturation protease, partial [Polyangiaceae bacterium]|nr:hydrogenase maturation protease [Polyangiaceae bacterium]
GLSIARALGGRGLDVREAADASVVLTLLDDGADIVLVDAVVGGAPVGCVVDLDPRALAEGPRPLSSHGVGVREAIELAAALYGDEVLGRVAIVGVVIERPARAALGLSDAVAAAIEPAAARAEALVAARSRSLNPR